MPGGGGGVGVGGQWQKADVLKLKFLPKYSKFKFKVFCVLDLEDMDNI